MIGQIIKEIRREQGVSRRHIRCKTGISVSTVHRLENGGNVRIETVKIRGATLHRIRRLSNGPVTARFER